MLTRQGWVVVATSVALVAAGRFLGTIELFVLGTAGIVLVVAVTIRAALAEVDVAVRRDVHPPRVHAGTPSRIELAVINHGSRTTPVLRIRDAVSGTRGADLSLAPIHPGGRARAAYRLPTERRGIITVGPLDLVLSDPFGLTRVTMRGAEPTELTVFPRIDPIAGMPETAGHDPDATNPAPSTLGPTGEEFFALRPFQIGDELRRVHWPSSARFDELQVRQTERPWQGRVTVLLDLRADVHTDASLDVAVSAAASILSAARRDGDLFRLVCTDGADSGFVPGNAAYAAVLEYLATVGVTRGSALERILDSVARSSNGGALVLVSGALTRHDQARVDAIVNRFSSLHTVVIDPSAWDPRVEETDVAEHPGRRIVVRRSVPFARAWNEAMVGRGRRRQSRASSHPGTTVGLSR